MNCPVPNGMRHIPRTVRAAPLRCRKPLRCTKQLVCHSYDKLQPTGSSESPIDHAWEFLKAQMQCAIACFVMYCSEYSALAVHVNRQARSFLGELSSALEKIQGSMERQSDVPPFPRVFYATCNAKDRRGFRESMVSAVEGVVGTIHVECISETEQLRSTTVGNLPIANVYLWVKIGPVWVKNDDQVREVFSRMRQDERCEQYVSYKEPINPVWLLQ